MRAVAARAENTVATLALGGIMLLPLSEIALRSLISTGIPGAAPFTLNLTLWVGLLGAAIAAREGKLLTLATGEFLPKGRIGDWAHVIGGFADSAIAMMFAVGGVGLVLTERDAGDEIALGVRTWVSTLAFPIGFTLIALRLAYAEQESNRLAGLGGREAVQVETRTYSRRDDRGAEDVVQLSLERQKVKIRRGPAGQAMRLQTLRFNTPDEAREAYFAQVDVLDAKGYLDATAGE